MTDDEKLVILKRMTGEKNTAVLSTYLSLAKSVVLSKAYPYNNGEIDEVPPKYDFVHIEIAVYMLNKRGAEGEVSHSENGVSRSYADGDVPPSLLRCIIPMSNALSSRVQKKPQEGWSCDGGGDMTVVPGPPGPAGADGKDGQDGAPGPAGADGKDGFSPTIEVSEIDGGHQVTITDVNGAQSFNVMDGVGSSGSSTTYKFGHGLKKEGNTVSVDMADDENPDKTLPISAAAVDAAVGNIEELLKIIRGV